MLLKEYLDHTALKPELSKKDIELLCNEAVEHGFKSVCVSPYFVQLAKNLTKDSEVLVCTVIGFPYGYTPTSAKAEEVKRAISDGADEVDVVVNLSAVKSKDWAYVANDIESLTLAAHMKGKIIKLILETGILEEDEIKKLCEICIEKEVDFVKTSTGVNAEGANIEIIQYLKKLLGEQIKIKASGGIRDFESACKMIEAGASRIGASRSVEIVNDVKNEIS